MILLIFAEEYIGKNFNKYLERNENFKSPTPHPASNALTDFILRDFNLSS